ncbi:MAG: hypothetical protein ACR2MO_17660 [Acidimicrobiales bacterium]
MGAHDEFDRDWPYHTASFAALGHHFAFRLADPQLGAYLDRALAPLTAASPAATWWTVVDRGDASAAEHRFVVYRGAGRLFEADSADDLVPLLLWWVNRVVCFETAHRIMVHAAVAAGPAGAVLLPAPAESGKTTLVAGLVGAGFAYLTDEAAAVDPATGAIEAYPKALSVDPGSWALFPHLRPDLPAELGHYVAKQWHVPPDAIRPGAAVASARPVWIITPRYEAGAATTIEPLSRPDALALLARESFNLARFRQPGLEALAAVVRACSCWRLVSGSLDEAVEAVQSVAGPAGAGASPS